MHNIDTGAGHGSFLSEEEVSIVEFTFFSLPTAGFEEDLQSTGGGLRRIVQLPTALRIHFFEATERGVEVVRLDLTPDPGESVQAADNKVQAEQAEKTQKPRRTIHVWRDGENLKEIGCGFSISLNIPLGCLFLGDNGPDN